MSHEIHSQIPKEETERTPEVRLFNVDAMSGEQVIVLHRALALAGDTSGPEGDIVNHSTVGDEMIAALHKEVMQLPPERLWVVVKQCNLSKEAADWMLAAYAARRLAPQDQELAIETLFSIATIQHPDEMIDELARDAAHDSLELLMRDQLTAEQNETLIRRYEEANGIGYLTPADADDWRG